MVGIIVKNFEHYNRAMGKYISSQRHYEEEMKKGGYVKMEDAISVSNKVKRDQKRDYSLSEKARGIIETVKSSADKKGNVHLSDRTIKAMIDIKAINKIPEYMKLPSHYEDGGFSS